MIRRVRQKLAKGSVGHDTLWGTGTEVLQIVTQLATFWALARSLGPDDYGSYVALYAFLGPFTILAGHGVIFSLHYELVRLPERFGSTVRSYVSLILLFGGVFALLGTILVRQVVPSIPLAAVIAVYVTELVLSPLYLGGGAIVNVRDSYPPAVRVRMIGVSLRLLLVVGLFAGSSLTVTSLTVTYCAFSVLLTVGLAVHLRRKYGVHYVPGRTTFAHVRSILNFSASAAALAVQNDGDKTVLAANKLTFDLGLYSAAYKMIQLAQVPLNTILGSTHQRFLTYHEQGEGVLLRKAMTYSAVCAAYGGLVVVGTFVVSPILPVILGDDFEGSVTMLLWLSPLVLLRGLSMFPFNALMGLRRAGARTVLCFVTAGISLALYIVLVPRYSWKGAAIGTFVGEACLAIGGWILLVHYHRRPLPAPDDARPDELEPAHS